MSEHNTRKEKLKIIFATYPQQDTVYMTSDEKAFFNEAQAESHAQRLLDKNVSKYPKKFWEQAIQILDKNEDSKNENTEGTEGTEGEGTEGTEGTEGESTEGTEGTQGTEGTESTEGTDGTESKDLEGTDQPSEDERAALAVKFEELSGKKPAWNMKLENLRSAVADLENANN
jgi:hypothetical protein